MGPDTEVLLRAYIHHGPDVLEKLDGMFAFVIVDEPKDQVLITRDPFGIKPLYLCSDGDDLYAASEIKALMQFKAVRQSASISRSDVFEFFQCGFVHEPRTGFENITKLMPGSSMLITTGGQRIFRYYDPLDAISRRSDSSPTDYQALIKTSVQRQLVADVPLGLFFSGGIDSTLLALESGKSTRLLSVSYRDSGDGSNVDDTYVDQFQNLFQYDLTRIALSETDDDIMASIETVAWAPKNSYPTTRFSPP